MDFITVVSFVLFTAKIAGGSRYPTPHLHNGDSKFDQTWRLMFSFLQSSCEFSKKKIVECVAKKNWKAIGNERLKINNSDWDLKKWPRSFIRINSSSCTVSLFWPHDHAIFDEWWESEWGWSHCNAVHRLIRVLWSAAPEPVKFCVLVDSEFRL